MVLTRVKKIKTKKRESKDRGRLVIQRYSRPVLVRLLHGSG